MAISVVFDSPLLLLLGGDEGGSVNAADSSVTFGTAPRVMDC